MSQRLTSVIALLAASLLASCDDDSTKVRVPDLLLEIDLELTDEDFLLGTGGFLLSTRFRNEGDDILSLVELSFCDQDIRLHSDASLDSEIIWTLLSQGVGCILLGFPDLELAPGEEGYGPQTGVRFRGLLQDGVLPGRHFVSLRWPVRIVRADGSLLEQVFVVDGDVVTVPHAPSP